MRGQASIEFLTMSGFALFILAMSIFLYSIFLSDVGKIGDVLEADIICNEISSSIASVASLGHGTVLNLSLRDTLNSGEYQVYITPNSRISINYGDAVRGCATSVGNISNLSGSNFFEVQKNSLIKYTDGGVLFEP